MIGEGCLLLGWGAWGKRLLPGDCPGREGASLLLRKQKKSVALGCKMEAFGVGDWQPGSTVSKSSSVGCVVPAQRQAGTAGGDSGCRL